MKAIRIHSHGCSDVLKVDNLNIPKCTENHILVNVKACSLNHLDIWVREGLPGLPIKLPLIMGSDASGTVMEVGKNIKNFTVGDDVKVQPGTFDENCNSVIQGLENYSPTYGILGETSDGTQAEYILLKETNLALKPKHLSFVEASSMALVFMTSYQMIVERAKLKKTDMILIYGATSGVGSAAIQIAKDIGATVVSTVGDNNKIDYAYNMGWDHVLLHDEFLSDNLKKYLQKRKFNVVFEHVGSATWNNSLKFLAIGGRLVTCGSTTGANVNIDLRHLFMKQQTILGSTMGNISSFNSVVDKISSEVYRPFIDDIFDFDKIKDAHKKLEERSQCGKIVIVPN